MQQDFLKYQLTFPRVQSAASRYESALHKTFTENNLNYPPQQLYIRGFKKEQKVEIWASDDAYYHLIRTYPFSATSGKPGPKQKEGDLQIPEGFYHLANFNPESKFHLSLKIDYPNQSDMIRSKNEENIGGDIYIHGGTETMGCIAIGDENIRELYWLCAKSYVINPVIPVHVFPCKMEENYLAEIYKEYPAYINFWNSLKPMYHSFESAKMLCKITDYDSSGIYQLDVSDNKI